MCHPGLPVLHTYNYMPYPDNHTHMKKEKLMHSISINIYNFYVFNVSVKNKF